MEVVIYGHDVEITPRLQSYVERKVERLDRYMPNIVEVQIDLSAQRSASKAEDREVAQITLRNARGTILRAEERTADMFASVDAVVDKLYRQIERYKGKRRRRGEANAGFEHFETAIQLEEDELESGSVIRRKQFSIVPMYEEEAIEQMELLGHDFFVFVNADSGGVNVLYRRHDENYGLLVPEFD